MENLTLKLESTGNEIIWREGTAPDIQYPKAVVLTGDIRAVGTFVVGRHGIANLQGIKPETAIVTIDKEAGTILLQTDPNDVYGSSVKSTLQISDELSVFGLNTGKMFSQKELIKLFKFSRLYFSDPLEQQDLMKQYMAFSFKTGTEGHSNSDDRGNKSQAMAKTVNTNLPLWFTLKIPIYKGERSVVFRVEICLDVTDGGAKMWFESVELHELQQTEKEIIFKRELEFCDGLVVIYK